MENQEVNAAPAKRSNGIGLAGFIIAIVGIILSWIPIVNIVAAILLGIAFILCLIGLIMGIVKKKTIVLSIIGLILSVAGYIIFGVIVAAAASELGSMSF